MYYLSDLFNLQASTGEKFNPAVIRPTRITTREGRTTLVRIYYVTLWVAILDYVFVHRSRPEELRRTCIETMVPSKQFKERVEGRRAEVVGAPSMFGTD